MVSRYTYDLQSRQLTRVTIKRPPGHPQGAQMLQDLHYGYDPMGNVLHQRDAAVAVEWHNNQQVDGERTYTYDTLSRLTAASGRGVSGSLYIRYALGDRQGSVMGESDEQGCVTAREEYYPYGGI